MHENKEGPMDQRWIFGSMLTAGLGLFGIVGWIQTDRHAFTTRPVLESDSIQMVIAPAKPAEVQPAARSPAFEGTSGQVIEMPLDSIVIRRRAPTPAFTPAAAEPHSPAPCSPWEEIGPVHVDEGNPSGVRRFRKLC
jgi:hypothetical protein